MARMKNDSEIGQWILRNEYSIFHQSPINAMWTKTNFDESFESIYITNINSDTNEITILYTTSIFIRESQEMRFYQRIKEEKYVFNTEKEIIEYFDLNNIDNKLINTIGDIYDV